MQYGLKVDIAFSGAKTIVCWLQRATWNKRYRVRVKSVALLQSWILKQKKIVVLKCNKMFFFFLRKLTKISNLILCFSEISNIYICVRARQGAFLSEDWNCHPSEAVSSLRFFALEMRERKAYKKQTCSNVLVLLNKVSALEYYRFKQVSLYIASWLFINT